MFTSLVLRPLLLLLLFFFTMLLSTAVTVPPLEAKRNQLMEKRFSNSLAALRENEDSKTILMLKAMEHEFKTEMQKLKPDYQKWYRTLSAEEKRMLLNQVGTLKWLQLMQEIQFDTCIQRRFRENAKLKLEYETIQFSCDKAAEIEL